MIKILNNNSVIDKEEIDKEFRNFHVLYESVDFDHCKVVAIADEDSINELSKLQKQLMKNDKDVWLKYSDDCGFADVIVQRMEIY